MAEIERLLKHGAYGALSEDCAEGDARTKAFAGEGIDDILARSERRVVEASDDDTSKSSDAQKSMFATATFTGEGGDGSDEIALDDPDFWQKLMPEAAEAERLREEKEAAEKAERLRQEEAAFARMKNGKPEVFVWTWTERKRVLSQLASRELRSVEQDPRGVQGCSRGGQDRIRHCRVLPTFRPRGVPGS